MPGMKPEMVELADVQLKSEWYLVKQLNAKLVKQGMPEVEFIAEAVTKLGDQYLSSKERSELQALLTTFFTEKTGSAEGAEAVIREWPEVMRWKRRVAFAHHVGNNDLDGAKLAVLKVEIQKGGPYTSVQTAAAVLIDTAERVLAEG